MLRLTDRIAGGQYLGQFLMLVMNVPYVPGHDDRSFLMTQTSAYWRCLPYYSPVFISYFSSLSTDSIVSKCLCINATSSDNLSISNANNLRKQMLLLTTEVSFE